MYILSYQDHQLLLLKREQIVSKPKSYFSNSIFRVVFIWSIYRCRSETELSNQSFKLGEYNQSELGEGGRGAHGTRLRRRQEGATELMKLSKVVVYNTIKNCHHLIK